MMPILFEVGGFAVHGYTVMLTLAFVIGGRVLANALRREGADPALGSTVTALALVFGIAGAHALWLLEHWPRALADPATVLGGGMTWYGGLGTATLAIYVYVRARGVPFPLVLDAAAPALMIAYGIGRLGCHLAGDGDYGLPTSLPWGTDYSRGLLPPSRAFAALPDVAARYPGGIVPDDTPLHPTPVYEFLLAVVGYVLLRAGARQRLRPGALFLLYIGLLGGFRFAVEFLRVNPRLAFGLSEAQLVSATLFAVGMGGLAYLATRGDGVRARPRLAGRLAIGSGPGDVVIGGGPRRRPIALTAVGATLLGWQIGCVPSMDVSNISDLEHQASRTTLTDVRFEPSFVGADTDWKLPPSTGNVYWLPPGEQVRVKWKDLLATADVGQGPRDCDLCAAYIARSDHHMTVCTDPAENQYLAFMELKELGVIVDGGRPLPPVPTNLQTIPLIWQAGCFAASTPPRYPTIVTVSRSAQWAVVILSTYDIDTSVAVTAGDPGVGLKPTIGLPVATMWVVPTGGRRVMDPRKLDPYVQVGDVTTWKWSLGTTDRDGTRFWAENFSPRLAVGRVRVFKAKIVYDDPFFPECEFVGCFQITGAAAPQRIRVYQSPNNPDTCPDLSCDLFFCRGDAATPDGNIDFSACRAPGPPPHPATPAYITDDMPTGDRPPITDPLTWVVVFNESAGFPAPVLADGEDLYIEFTLLGPGS
ncbi:MAG TPA: prolipoprotein diacylglyceryl transferase [Methylomirabilota bacterium]|jgi:phosphatidylglycerol:prolipoprotein diacylglycerol transferase